MKRKNLIISLMLLVAVSMFFLVGCDLFSEKEEEYDEVTPEVIAEMQETSGLIDSVMDPLTSGDPESDLGITIGSDGSFTYSETGLLMTGTIIETETSMSMSATLTLSGYTDGTITLNGNLTISITQSLNPETMIMSMSMSQSGSITATGATITSFTANNCTFSGSYSLSPMAVISESYGGSYTVVYSDGSTAKYRFEDIMNYEEE